MKFNYILNKTTIIGKKGEIFTFDPDTNEIYAHENARIPVNAIKDFSKHFTMLQDEKVFLFGTRRIVVSGGSLFVDGREIGHEWVEWAHGSLNKSIADGVGILSVKCFGITMAFDKYVEILEYAMIGK